MSDSRAGVLRAVSDWLKLLALVVLVAEVAILAAMKFTPDTNPVHGWYPVFMLVFLAVVVVGVFVDRYLQSRKRNEELTVEVGDVEWRVETRNTLPAEKAAKPNGSGSIFVDSERGFQFELPKSPGWSKPERLDFGQYMIRAGLFADEEAVETARRGMELVPMGKMFADSSVLCVWYGDPIDVALTEESTTAPVEAFIDRLTRMAEDGGEEVAEEDKSELRRSLLTQSLPISQLKIQNGITILALDKELARNSPIRPNLANVFRMNIVGGVIFDKLAANDHAIAWGTTITVRNVLINGEQREITMNRLCQLTEGEDYFYQVEIFYSPQTEESLSLWDQLQNASNSFNKIEHYGART